MQPGKASVLFLLGVFSLAISHLSVAAEDELGVNCDLKGRCIALARSKITPEFNNKQAAEEEAAMTARGLLSKKLKNKVLVGVSEFSYVQGDYVYVCVLYSPTQEEAAKDLARKMNPNK